MNEEIQDPAEATADGVLLHRIGAVSRMTGVPVTTLRVWETRYAAFVPAKSSGRHRLYTDADIVKARLLRQLAGAGHGVGAIAHLPTAQLQQLWGRVQVAQPAATASEAPRISIAMVGVAIAARVHAPQWRQRWFAGTLQVREAFAGLDEVQAAPPAEGEPLDILLVRLNALHVGTHEQLARAIDRLRPQRVILLYNYAAQHLVASLQAAGVTLRREPVPDGELADLIRSVVLVDPARSMAGAAPMTLIPQRRYSDATLARVAASQTNMLCECPRHIADLIGQLASFEEYSQQCINTSGDDAHLHAHLRSIAGSARALFEHALEMAAQHSGLQLGDEVQPGGA